MNLTSSLARPEPELSMVIPCFNEEECLPLTVPALAEAFQAAGVRLEFVLVDNGSRDRTSAVIDTLIARGLPIVKAVVPVNQGQGLGVLTGLPPCRGRYIGWVCADGQVAPQDVVQVFLRLRGASVPSLAKVRRRFRPDGWLRKVVSIVYNGLMQVAFPGMPSIDVNGTPKIMHAEIARLMELTSRDWFLDPETMLKAWYLGIPVIEIDSFGQLRNGGLSHVRAATVIEFLKNIFRYRFGGPWRSWQKRVDQSRLGRLSSSVPTT